MYNLKTQVFGTFFWLILKKILNFFRSIYYLRKTILLKCIPSTNLLSAVTRNFFSYLVARIKHFLKYILYILLFYNYFQLFITLQTVFNTIKYLIEILIKKNYNYILLTYLAYIILNLVPQGEYFPNTTKFISAGSWGWLI